MPRAGLAEQALQLSRAAVADEETGARFRAKVRTVPGIECELWSSARSGRGHGRQYFGWVEPVGVTSW